jgi:hypothetical protein
MLQEEVTFIEKFALYDSFMFTRLLETFQSMPKHVRGLKLNDCIDQSLIIDPVVCMLIEIWFENSIFQ